MFCRSLFVLLSLFFLPLCCLFFFDNEYKNVLDMYKLIIINYLIMYCCFTDHRSTHVYLISYLPWKQHHFWQVHTQVDKISKSHLVSSWFIDWLINCLFSVERFMARARLGTIGHVENISTRLTARTKLGTIRYVGNKQTLATVKGWMFHCHTGRWWIGL
jgi:hypothetical protein